MTPEQYCQDKAARSGSSFYYSFLFLPPEQRRAITALYAFCREVDDVVDECHDAGVARVKLDWWRGEIEATFQGHAQHPVTQALSPAIRDFGLALEPFTEIVDGMEMDLRQERYPDFKALQLYCYRVASVVGHLSASIFGYQDHRTLRYAHDLGMAFQLTNIIRDVGEDARRGRLYLPLDELGRFSVDPQDITEGRNSDNFGRLMAFQIERALGYYTRALSILPAVDRKAQRPGIVMAAIYRTLLDEIGQDAGQVLTRRVSLTPVRKLWIAWKTWARN
ncbi:MAG: presqualene diphosphate synthase HpnD [Betaproteobacteria bacterium]|nr:presqualene diphosphate synthase HpnD [Betaproteobacteria bacterium]